MINKMIRVLLVSAGLIIMILYSKRTTNDDVYTVYDEEFRLYCGVEEVMQIDILDNIDIDADTVDNKDNEVIEINSDERAELAKIIMAEAGGEDIDGKILVGNVILNRVESDEFPDDIISVIRQKNNVSGVYQFSPVASGIINEMIPSDECYEAIDMILGGYDISNGALYFESYRGESWHSENLTFLFRHGGHKFYK